MQTSAALISKTSFPKASGLLLIAIFVCILSFPQTAFSCAMSALISIGHSRLDQFEAVGPSNQFYHYDDPWDYVGFVMANSSWGANSDGYGVIAYPDGIPYLTDNDLWYKRVLNSHDFGDVYYTGHHLDPDYHDSAWVPDVLDTALAKISNGGPSRSIVMCHARSASRPTMGNHPFTFNYRDRTYSLMHNGYCETSRSFMISRIASLQPDIDWFSSFPSNHFNDPNPLNWVDTEVLFHYIMAHLVACDGDVLRALNRALSGLKHYMDQSGGGVYNFILSDGERLYAFRSSPKTGSYSSYKLSYHSYSGRYHAIRTQYPSNGDIELNKQELVVLSNEETPVHYPDICSGYLENNGPPPQIERYYPNDLIPTPMLVYGPNPSFNSVDIKIRYATVGDWKVQVFDTRGKLVWHTHIQIRSPGFPYISWQGTDDRGTLLPSGLYIIRAVSADRVLTGKISLIRSH